MIEVNKKIHDNYTIEFKIGYNVDDVKLNNFFVKMWIFVPNSLDINRQKYNSDIFYSDLKEKIRLITPVFNLKDIAGGNARPLYNLKGAMHLMAVNPSDVTRENYEYDIKMFLAIFRSSSRDMVNHIITQKEIDEIEVFTKEYVESIYNITKSYRELMSIINVSTVLEEHFNYYKFGDEYISNTIDYYTFRLLKFLNHKLNNSSSNNISSLKYLIDEVSKLLIAEKEYRQSHNYMLIAKGNSYDNRNYVFRMGVLKRFVDSDLFLDAKKKKDAVLTEQLYYSLAAGLSMIFATGIAFSFQQRYGNFTMPLFVALVVSYMLKDRIKDLMRIYFAHKKSARYFDNKTTISIGKSELGWSREAFDLISEERVPKEVLSVRARSPLLSAENRYNRESIMLYRKHVKLDKSVLDENSNYNTTGVNEILRFSLRHFMNRMDNPQEIYSVFDDNGNIQNIGADEVYYLNFILQLTSGQQDEYRRYRVVCTRDMIMDIEEMC